jgi:hypothetical protein
MNDRHMIEVAVIFHPRGPSVRETVSPDLRGLHYRPHIVIGDPARREAKLKPDGRTIDEDYLGIAFSAGPDVVAIGDEVLAEAALVYWPDVDYSKVVPGSTFTVREGPSVVGHGRVIRRWEKAG